VELFISVVVLEVVQVEPSSSCPARVLSNLERMWRLHPHTLVLVHLATAGRFSVALAHPLAVPAARCCCKVVTQLAAALALSVLPSARARAALPVL
jgi:hypothetical protein